MWRACVVCTNVGVFAHISMALETGMPIPAVLRLTIAECAKSCGVSARTLRGIEREESSPALATAEKLLRPVDIVPGAAPRARQR